MTKIHFYNPRLLVGLNIDYWSFLFIINLDEGKWLPNLQPLEIKICRRRMCQRSIIR